MAAASFFPSSEGTDNVRVCVRVRPFNEREKSEQKILVANPSARTVTFDSRPEPKVFPFDFVANEKTTQEEMWTQVAKPVVDTCMAGYNGTILAYGQTGSGKTFTIQGGVRDNGELIPELRGLVPRSFEYLFKAIQREEQTSGGRVSFLCKCSYLEIFQEQICDLLNPTAQTLNIREDMNGRVYVEGLMEEVVRSPDEAYRLLLLGARHRHTSPTAMNERSSRSHSVFTLSIESTETKETVTSRRFSKLSLVDLAGSERQKSTEAAGQRLKEAGSINKSLFLLGNVIRDLVDNVNGKPKHIPYRNSRLTFLLRDSLGGNSKTTLVATISAAADSFSETLSTLKFAARAKLIRNQAVINQDLSVSVPELQSEVKRLKEELSAWQARATTTTRRAAENNNNNNAHEDKASDQRIRELESLLLAALDRAQASEEECARVSHELHEAKSVNEKKESYVQNAKLLVKLRDSEIAAMKGKPSKDAKETASEREKSLLTEIKALKAQLEAAPAQAEQAQLFLETRNRLRFLESQFAPDIELHAREVPKMQRFIHGLNSALHDAVSDKNYMLAQLHPSRAASLNPPSSSTAQIEELQAELSAALEEINQLKELHSKVEAEAAESQTLAAELEQALVAEKETRQRQAVVYEENLALLKEAYRTELLEPSARTEEAISSLLNERSQLQSKLQQQLNRIKELEFLLKAKEQPVAALGRKPRRYSTQPSDAPAIVPEESSSNTRPTSTAAPSLALAALEKKLQKRETALEQTTRELSTLRDEFETLQAEFRFREEQTKRQAEELHTATESIKEMEVKLANAEERAASTEEMMRRQAEALEAAKQSGKASDQLMLESVEDNTRLRRQVQQLQEEVERTEEALREANASKETIMNEATSHTKEIEQLQRCLEERNEFCEKLREAVRVHEQDVKSLRAQLAEARLEAEAASRTGQAISNELEHAKEEAEELRAVHEADATELNALKDELAKKHQDWLRLEAELREENALLTVLNRKENEELAAERAETSSLRHEIATEREAWANERSKLVSEAETSIAKAEAAKKALKKSASEKFEEIQRLENDRYNKLQEKLTEQEVKTASIEDALEAVKTRHAAAEKEARELHIIITAKESQIRQVEARLAETIESLKNAETTLQAKTEAEAVLEERLANMQLQLASQVRTAESEAAALKEEVEKLQQQLTVLNAERTADQEQFKQLKEAEVRAFEETLTWKNRAEQLQEEKLAIKKSYTELESQNASLVSHANLKQKIHLHTAIKDENNALRRDLAIALAKLQKAESLNKKMANETKKPASSSSTLLTRKVVETFVDVADQADAENTAPPAAQPTVESAPVVAAFASLPIASLPPSNNNNNTTTTAAPKAAAVRKPTRTLH